MRTRCGGPVTTEVEERPDEWHRQVFRLQNDLAQPYNLMLLIDITADQSCIFCGITLGGNRAKEHVVPSWLLQHLGIEREIVIPAVARTEDSEIVDRRRHT